jgi:uncharacterized protein (DUF1778 family)
MAAKKRRGSAKHGDRRLEVRLTPKARDLLRRAAAVDGQTISTFIRAKSLAAAAETLADQCAFPLRAKTSDAFWAALEQPAKQRPRLENESAHAF